MGGRVVVVGAGIVGLCIAWQLCRRGHRDVVVLEQAAAIGAGSTGASSAICRHRYSAPAMIRLARAGIDCYRNWPAFTGLATPRARFQNDGVLWFTGDDRAWADREHQRLQDFGIRTTVLDDEALAERFPAINPCTRNVDLVEGEEHACRGSGRHLLEDDGGYIDPMDAAQDLLEACRGADVDVRFDAAVDALLERGGRVIGVHLRGGETLPADQIVNAAGPWCQALYTSVGLTPPMPLAPVRIQMLYLDRPAAVAGTVPVCADMQSGIYFRSQNRGQQLIVGSIREEDEREIVADPDRLLTVADDAFCAEKLHLLQHRLRGFTPDRSLRSYCGLYTVNLGDVHPLVGSFGPEGLYVANGFSGHGFKIAPAVGAILARHITGRVLEGEDARDDSWLAPQRAPIAADSRSVLA